VLQEQLTTTTTAAAAAQPVLKYGNSKANEDNLRMFPMTDGTMVHQRQVALRSNAGNGEGELLNIQGQALRQEQGATGF
jgi:hypothetical protein